MTAPFLIALLLLTAGQLAWLPAALAQAVPVGSEFVVNTYTSSVSQHEPAVAGDGAGNFVVVWSGTGGFGSDTGTTSIQAQRYDATGALVGGQFQVNSYTTDAQYDPRVAFDGAGNFVVVWQSFGSAGTDDDLGSIQGQRFDATGAAVGAQFQVNTYTTNAQGAARVAAVDDGSFVVAWQSLGSSGTDTSNDSIQAQRYDATGAAVGGQFQVNTYTTSSQGNGLGVATDSGGNFVVAWASSGSSGTDTSSYSIQGQRYDATGAAVGGQFQVNSYTSGLQFQVAVAAEPGGNFVVVWCSAGSAGSDSSLRSVQGQRYDATGATVGGEFQVNTYTTGTVFDANVATDAAGSFVVTWTGVGSAGSDTSSYSIQSREYDSDGLPLGDQFQVNTYTTGLQSLPSVATDGAGGFLVTWRGARPGFGATLGQRFSVSTTTTIISSTTTSTVAVCGDGVTQLGESCDEGASNGLSESCCTVSCTYVMMGTPCRPVVDLCDLAENCSGTSGICPPDVGKLDGDLDGTCDEQDNCPAAPNPDQRNSDTDPAGDVCDPCATDPMNACNVSQSASAVIYPGADSALQTPDQRVKILVPNGAISEPTTFSITGITNSEFGAGTSATNLIAVVKLEPEGVTFVPPVSVVFAWQDANNDGKVDGTNIRERNIKVYRNGVVVPGTTTCDAQPCTAAACCSMAANTWTLQISTFSEWALGGTPCVEAETSKLTLRKVLPPTGDDKLTFVGTLTLPGPGSIETQLDVVNDGVVVRLVDGDVVVLDTEIPGGAYDAGTETGWKVNGLHTAWIYFAPPTGGPGGIKKLKLLDQTANTPGLVKVVVKGSGGAYAAGAAVDAALVLPDSGQCFAATYPAVFPLTPSCIATGGGATIRCR